MTTIPLELRGLIGRVRHVPLSTISIALIALILVFVTLVCHGQSIYCKHYVDGHKVYLSIVIVAPAPRPPRLSEKQYRTITPSGRESEPQPLISWCDEHEARKELALDSKITPKEAYQIGPAEVYVTVVVPAYNEENRLNGMLEEAVDYLARAFPTGSSSSLSTSPVDGKLDPFPRGWEILVVSDGSTDKTVETALAFIRKHQAASNPPTPSGPWSRSMWTRPRSDSEKNRQKTPAEIPYGSIRVVDLEQNRGKGGAVTHGMRHARGAFVAFADADGASRMSDLSKLIRSCERVQDEQGRAVGIGSRAHLAGGEDVVKVSREVLFYTNHTEPCSDRYYANF